MVSPPSGTTESALSSCTEDPDRGGPSLTYESGRAEIIDGQGPENGDPNKMSEGKRDGTLLSATCGVRV